MPSGLEFPHIIDLYMMDPDTERVVLVMNERRPWSGHDEQIFQLQEKMNAYMSFALDGEMTDESPDLASLPLRIELRCASEPDERTLHYLKLIHDQLALQDVQFLVSIRQTSEEACGGDAGECGCG